MKKSIRLFVILAAAAAATACLPAANSPQGYTPSTAGTAAPTFSALKPVSPVPPSPYPALPPTPTPYPDWAYPGGGYPAAGVEEPYQMNEMEIFLGTRAAELMVPRLEGELYREALELFEGTRQATIWQELDRKTLQNLALAWERPLDLQPGATYSFSVGLPSTIFYTFPEIAIESLWSVSPADGATIDPHTGVFSVDEDTPHGAVYTVTADVENGRAAPAIDVYIYTMDENPLVGHWHEEKQFSCIDEEESIPDQNETIGEMKFKADGTFSVAWFPFETYKDYWGTYTYEKATGELIMTIEDGNYMPADFDGSGNIVMDGNDWLKLKEIWLGKPQHVQYKANCGHLFVRSPY